MIDVWKSIVGYETSYQVSNLGNVRSLPRICFNPRYGEYVVRGRLLMLTNSGGYKYISLYKAGKKEVFPVHQLVAEAFLGYKKRSGSALVIDHIDANKSHNHVNNLRIVTFRENVSLGYKKSKLYSHLPTGVYYHKKSKKWAAVAFLNGKKVHLGLGITPEEAGDIYTNRIKNLHYND